ncbi:MAG: GNAT family N-acetyltransferase [Blastocatellia bacterium]
MNSSMDIAVRTAGPSDAELLARIGAATFIRAFAEYNTREDMAAYVASAFSPEIQAVELLQPGVVFLIASSSRGQTAGYAKLDRSEPPECVKASRPLEIVRFYVEAEWHGCGVSHCLMSDVFRRAQGANVDMLWLGVWERNARAIAFYQKFGFEIVGRKNFTLGSDLQSDNVMTRAVASP